MILRKLELGSYGTNCYIIGDEATKEGIIIDPGAEGDYILKQVKSLDLKIKLIVLTHSHMDHIGALAEVRKATGAEIAVHEDEAPFLQNQTFRMMAMTPPNATLTVERLLKEGDVITFGKIKLKVLHTPGHTRGGISLVGDGIVFTGDTLFNFGVGRADFPGASFAQEMDSIRNKLMALPDDYIVCPGHGPDSKIGAERKGNPWLTGTHTNLRSSQRLKSIV